MPIENPQNNLNELMNSGVAKTVEDNRHIIKCCAQSVIFADGNVLHLEGILRHSIQKEVVQEVKRSKYFSILVDEVTSFNKEIMPFVRLLTLTRK